MSRYLITYLFFFIPLLVNAEPKGVLVPYSDATGLKYLMYSYSAYCKEPALTSWNCYWCKNTTKVNVQKTFFNKSSNTFAWLGYSDTEIILSFRGTQPTSLKNWITDLNFAQKAPFASVPDAQVHRGFYKAYLGVREHILLSTKELSSRFPSLPILITGHSLGGALSILASIDISLQINHTVQVWNFGCPRVGNSAFETFYESLPIANTYRVINNQDIVPHLPPKVLGFAHSPVEVWYTDPNNYKVCSSSNGEDPTCSNSVINTSIADHLLYFGIDEKNGAMNGC